MNKIYQFRLELRDTKPRIWRTVQVNSKMTVAEFSYIVLVLFEMQASHLMKVTVPVGQIQIEKFKKLTGDSYNEEAFLKEHPELPKIRYRYELLDMIDDFPRRDNDIIFNITKESLTHAISEIGDRMELWYDFGDDWFIDIKLTDIIEAEEETFFPLVLNGKGFGIIEDCGGPWRLNDIIKAYKTKTGHLYKDMCDWLGIDDFDFSYFDINEMNERLQVIPHIYKRSYEEKKAPTKEEIDYIDRNY
jgi:hypothetical protein